MKLFKVGIGIEKICPYCKAKGYKNWPCEGCGFNWGKPLGADND